MASYNNSPYFDDFNANKNFLRVLFRPGRAVQARELTQAQTILQNQISSMASTIFKENSRVVGATTSIKTNKLTLVLNTTDSNNVAVDVNVLKGLTIQDATNSSTQAIVTDVDVTQNAILLDIKGGSFVAGSVFHYLDAITGTSSSNAFTVASTHYSMIAHIDSGIVFVDKKFITVPSQSIVVDSSVTMSSKEFNVGYIVNEHTVDSTMDSSLVDNASGSLNFNAPGADRLSESITLSSYEVLRDASGVETSIAPNNFRKVMLIKNGVVLSDLIQNVKYSDILDLLAHRTSLESGNYVVRPYRVTTKASTNPANFAVDIGEGSAFVNGYELNNQFTKTLEIPKSRDFSTATNQQLYFGAGAYFDVLSFTGAFDVDSEESLTFYNGAGGTGTVLGTADVLSVVRNSFGDLRVYIQNYDNFVSSFSSVSSFVGATSGAKADVIINNNKAVYSITNHSDAIVDVYGTSSYNNIKSIPAASVSYDVVKTFSAIVETTAGSQTYVLNAPNTSTDFYVTNGVYAIVNSTGVELVLGTDYSISSVINTNGSISTMTIATVAAQGNISVIVPMYKSTTTARLKNVVKGTQENITSDANGKVTLTSYDIINFISVEDMTDPANPVIVSSSSYITDNGQRNWIYDFGSITGLAANTAYRVTVDHFNHTTTGDYFSVDSYISLPANLDSVTGFPDLYSMIGNYSNGTTTYKLINCIDTRMTVANAGNSDKIRAESQNLQIDYDYYIGRIDKVYMDSRGNFQVLSGIPSANPKEPTSIPGSMEIAMFNIPPYTHTFSDVSYVGFNNTRYTMADIARLESRLRNVEDYTSLSMLEKTAQSMSITDAAGLNRYKNGIFVDDFTSHANGNTSDPNYNATIDVLGGLMAKQTENFNRLNARTANRTNIAGQNNLVDPALSADTVSLGYTEVEFIAQKANSNTINVNPYAAVIWHGQAAINPSSDVWVDTTYLPASNNVQGSVVQSASHTTIKTTVRDQFSMVYNPWNNASDPSVMAGILAQQTSRRALGIPHTDTLAQSNANILAAFNGEPQTDSGWTQVIMERDRTTTSTANTVTVVPTSHTTTSDSLVSSSTIPYMRSQVVHYTLSGMRPNQTLIASFDGVDVTSNCSNLIADQHGGCSGTFTIPAGKFLTGTKNLKFYDADATTDANADYFAQGTLQHRLITTTTIRGSRTINTTSTQVTTSEAQATVWLDPIAQSFLPITPNNEAGVYVTSIDLFFSAKATDLPVRIFLVPTSSGIPTQNIVPMSDVSLNPSRVNTSANGFTATNFKFQAPVYLEANVEYAVVITSNSNDYSVWYAKQGEPTLLNQAGQTETNRSGLATSKQPYLGVMFKSQNSSTWTEDQSSDLKFVINRCEFNTNDGSIYFDTEDMSVATGNGNEGMLASRIQPKLESLIVDGTNIAYDYSLDNGTTWNRFENISKIYNSSTLTLSTLAGNKPFSVRATMTTNSSWLSPMIDLNRTGYATSYNVYDVNGVGGTYISKTVQLQNSALDFRVMIDLLEPAGSKVDVFFSTQTPQVPMSATNDTLSYSAIDLGLVGVDCFVYHRQSTTGNVTNVGGFVPTKITSTDTFATNISNIDMFIAPASSTTYATVDKVFYTKIAGLTNVIDWVAGSHTIGSYVFYNNAMWKALSTTSATPTTNSIDWLEIPSISTTSSMVTNNTITWRPMTRTKTLPASIDSGSNFFTYTMIPDSIIEQPFDKFAVKIVLTSTNDAVTPTAQNLRAVAAT